MFKLEMTPFSSPSFRTFEPPKLDSGAPLSELRSVVRSRYDLDPRYVPRLRQWGNSLDADVGVG